MGVDFIDHLGNNFQLKWKEVIAPTSNKASHENKCQLINMDSQKEHYNYF